MTQLKILLVEDEARFGQMIQKLLVDKGHFVVYLDSSNNASQMIENRPFDVLVTDYDLGFREMTGLELCDHTHIMSPDTVTILFSSIDRSWEAKKEMIFPDHILVKNEIDKLISTLAEIDEKTEERRNVHHSTR